MGYQITRQGDADLSGVYQFVCDELSDLDNIPVAAASAGSTVLVIATADVYMLNTDRQWKLL